MFLLSLALVVPVSFSMFVTTCFPEHFTSGIYGLLTAQHDYVVDDHTDNRVLIIGDSLAQVSYMPSELSNDTYNFGIGNETPVDGYYRLMEYLQTHDQPEYIICSYNPTEFSTQSSIWDTTIYLHGLSMDTARKIIADGRKYSDACGVNREYARLQLFAYYHGIHPASVKMSLKALFRNLFGSKSCYENYIEQYDWVVEHRGQWKHHMTGCSGDDINTEIASHGVVAFAVTDMADAYMRKIAGLCDDMGIQLIIETIPFNESTYVRTNSSYIDSYHKYWERFQRDCPNVIVNSEITSYDNRYFSDCFHFNGEGTDRYSQYIREKYAYIFEETST